MGLRRSWLLGTALVGLMNAPAGCVLPRRQIMLVLNTDMECAVFDRFEVRVLRGTSDDIVWTRRYRRSDCPATGESIPAAPLTRGNGVDPAVPYRLGIVDGRRTEERVRVVVEARRADALVMSAIAETEFVDGQVYAVPMELSQVCLGARLCPANFACRRDTAGNAACGSIYRAPGTLGTFTAISSLTVDDTADLDAEP